MKINILRAILLILLLAIFNIIFGFSSQNGEQSSSVSREITEIVTKNIAYIQKLEPIEKETVLTKIEHIIRKLAHFSLYTAVGILAMSLMSTYKLHQRNRIYISLGVGVLYAISDEIHQAFIPNRTPLVGDVFIDTCGIAFGIILSIFFVKIITKIITKE